MSKIQKQIVGFGIVSLVLLTLGILLFSCWALVSPAIAEEPVFEFFVYLPRMAREGAVCGCSGNLYNCTDFETQQQAQACFDYCVEQGHGDIHGLGADDDGIACEGLPRPTATPAELPTSTETPTETPRPTLTPTS